MDTWTAKYIVAHFGRLMTDLEKAAMRHSRAHSKLREAGPARAGFALQKGWFSTDPLVVALLKEGYAQFEQNVARRILSGHSGKIFLNNCPACGQLARTPYARQCRACGNSWHHIVTARFQLRQAFQPKGRHLFLAGEIKDGQLQAGDFVDLTMLGLAHRPQIEAIEFVLHQREGASLEETALGIHALPNDDQAYLLQSGASCTPLDILRQ